ncbi:MAG: DEAD/DEAH box helicase family protein [Lachnospiraceae bacterium]|nr:DEAD/DEAH box helicase family protein [Lachnospiraceae bacterium]
MGYSKFQENSIENIYNMFKEKKKVLLADEVGLGKTLIAAGVMEKMFLQCDKSCGNVIYIAPSTLLINENIYKFKNKSAQKRFNILSNEKINRPIKTIGQIAEGKKELSEKEINLFACSQGVLFATKSQEGDLLERTILVCIIKAVIESRDKIKSKCKGVDVDTICNSLEIVNKKLFDLDTALQCRYDGLSKTTRYGTIKKHIDNTDIAVNIIESVNRLIINSQSENELINKSIEPTVEINNRKCSFFELIGMESVDKDKVSWLYSRFRDNKISQEPEYLDKCTDLINLVRLIVNIALIKQLNVKLIILDEFHKYFRKTEQNVLDLILDEAECQLLMLSATPYRMSIEGISDDADEGDKKEPPAFENFTELLEYLFDGDENPQKELKNYISDIKELSNSKEVDKEKWEKIKKDKVKLEGELKKVISRNERSECYKTDTIIETRKYTDDTEDSDLECFVSEFNTYKGINELLSEKIPLGYIKEIPCPLKYANDYKSLKSLKSISEEIQKDRTEPHFLLDVLNHRIEDNKLNECLWIPPSCKKDVISKILVFVLYRASTRAIKDIINKKYNTTPNITNNSITSSIDIFNISNYLPNFKTEISMADLDELNSAFRNYFTIHSNVLQNVPNINDIDSYCRQYALKEVLEEYLFIMDRDWDRFKSGILSALNLESSMLVETIDEDNTKNEVAERFQTPFYPFVLAATSSIQEGVDLHNYCIEVMHWHIPASPVEFEQREGRVDRRISYLVRKRAWEKCGNCNISWEDIFNSVGDGFDGLQPYWFVPTDSDFKIKIRRIIAYHNGSKEEKKYDNLINTKNYYRLSLGTGIDEKMLGKLHELLKDRDSSELFLSLKP